MKNMTLFNLIVNKTVDKWRNEFEETDKNGFVKDIDKYKKLLIDELNERQLYVVRHLEVSMADNFNSSLNFVCAKLLNLGIKIGMELQKFYDENRE